MAARAKLDISGSIQVLGLASREAASERDQRLGDGLERGPGVER